MDESELQHNLELYRAQLCQVEQAYSVAGRTEELQTLIDDLNELITLTEGSLLSVKKSQLLKRLEDAEADTGPGLSHMPSLTASQAGRAQSSPLDDEYAAFQMAVQSDMVDKNSELTSAMRNNSIHSQPSFSPSSRYPPCSGESQEMSGSAENSSDSSSTHSSDMEGDTASTKGANTLAADLVKLVGMKCCAPFSYDWGKMDYHNAMVVSASRHSESDKIQVTVMFTTPTHNSMRPCQFFLDGHCKFNEDKCKYSHGQTVWLEELRDFVEADHSTIAVDTRCLARYSDGIWYPATVTDVKEDVVSVHFDNYGDHLDLDMAQVVPTISHAVGNDSSEDETPQPKPSTSAGEGRSFLPDNEEDEEDGEEELPMFLWKPPQTTIAMGEWEAHTRGIGSKLMVKMGYVPGQGLGVNGQGKAEPVPIMLLPQGKSLDRIMELKTLAGSADLFNAMKQLERQQKKAEKRELAAAREASGQANGPPKDVFDFLNNKLAVNTGDIARLSRSCGRIAAGTSSGTQDTHRGRSENTHPHDWTENTHRGRTEHTDPHGRTAVSEHDLHGKSDRDLNLQVLKTEEEIRSVRRHLDRLRQQLARNENKDRKMAAQVRKQVAEKEAYLSLLRMSSSALERHQKRRKHSQKLDIF